jgi:NADH-quinone oxidoreductase subunit M
VLVGVFLNNSWVALFAGTGMVLGAGYSLWLLNRILFGNPKNFSIIGFKDLTRMEFFILLPFIFLTILLGVFPELIINFIGIC